MKLTWTKCADRMPAGDRPDDPDSSNVVLATGDNRDESLIQVDIMNAHFFRLNWVMRGYTHWMYCPDPPAKN